MSISSELLEKFPGIESVKTENVVFYGEDAKQVTVVFSNGTTLTGTFTHHPRSSFGGVDFNGQKDIVGLMAAKINSVINGNYDRSDVWRKE